MRKGIIAVIALFVWPVFGQDNEAQEAARKSAAIEAGFQAAQAAMDRAAAAAKATGANLTADIQLKLEQASAAFANRATQDALFVAQSRATQAAQEKMNRDVERANREVERAGRDLERADSIYNRGTRAIDRREYERAIEYFNQVVESKADRADGALYWKAYAQNKMGQRDRALATIAQLQKEHPQSRWLNDAKALELEVRQAAGRPVAPGAESDEDLKLLALNGLMQSDPERSVPILEKLLKDPKAAPKLKERALFVLAQSRDAQARTIIGQIAKGGSNPDLQMKAVEYLGVFGRGNGDLLNEVYRDSNDVGVRRAVIRGYMQSADKERLAALLKTEQNPELRLEVIRMLGVTHAQAELENAYRTETNTDVRREILRAMMISGDADRLLGAAKTEKDPKLRVEAIHLLGTMSRDKTGPALISMYSSEQDAAVKEAIVNALFIQSNATALVNIARKETDPKLKKALVERLSVMRSKEATDYLMEVLNK